MLLLDHNIPRKVKAILMKYGLPSRSAVEQGWDTLENGDLVAKAVENGFTAILTRDRRFQTAAANSLKKFPTFAIVLLNIPQGDSATYCAAFEKAWVASPFTVTAGKLIEWP